MSRGNAKTPRMLHLTQARIEARIAEAAAVRADQAA
jgi:hypothetical protein